MILATINPSTGQREMLIEPHSATEVEECIQLADDASRLMHEATFAQRAVWMNQAADVLEDQAEGLAELIAVEMGKPAAQSIAEVHKSVTVMRYYAENAEHLLTIAHGDTPEPSLTSQQPIQHDPLGIILGIMPWNHPLLQVVQFAAPALMAGNGGLLGHSPNVPQCALLFHSLFVRAGFPLGAFQTLLLAESEFAGIARDDRVKAVAFTGTEAASHLITSIARTQGKKVILDLSNSGPFVVLPSADIAAALDAAVQMCTTNSGQSCSADRRIVVHTDVYDEFSHGMVQRMSALTVGDPLDPKTDIGPLATREVRDRLVRLITDAVADGATVLTGGAAFDSDGFFYPPTVLSRTKEDSRAAEAGAYGPVAMLYRAASNKEVLTLATQYSQNSTNTVWAADPLEQNWIISGLRSRTILLNSLAPSDRELPFEKLSPSEPGRDSRADRIREFCNPARAGRPGDLE